jgi:hypothetical protein
MAWTLLMYALLFLDYMVSMLQDLDATDVCIPLSRLHDIDAPWPGRYCFMHYSLPRFSLDSVIKKHEIL